MNPDQMSVTELKAMVYDCMAIKEQQDVNIKILNQKIAEKSKPVPVTEKKEVQEK